MRRVLLIFVVVLLGAGSAEARHRHSWYRYGEGARAAARVPTLAPGVVLTHRSARNYGRALRREFPPADWQLQPPDASWKGRRYVSPDGDAWVAFYTSPADPENTSEHLKSVAFADGENILTLVGDRNGVEVTGAKGERMFVRKAKLACGGRQWHHVAFEFPAGARRAYQGMVAQAAGIVDLSEDDGCTTPLAETESR